MFFEGLHYAIVGLVKYQEEIVRGRQVRGWQTAPKKALRVFWFQSNCVLALHRVCEFGTGRPDRHYLPWFRLSPGTIEWSKQAYETTLSALRNIDSYCTSCFAGGSSSGWRSWSSASRGRRLCQILLCNGCGGSRPRIRSTSCQPCQILSRSAAPDPRSRRGRSALVGNGDGL